MKWIVRLILIAFCIICMYKVYIRACTNNNDYKVCGVVKGKSGDERVGKYRIITDYYLNVLYDNNKLVSERVSRNTYINYESGDNICLIKTNSAGIAEGLMITLGVLFLIVLFVIIVVVLFEIPNYIKKQHQS